MIFCFPAKQKIGFNYNNQSEKHEADRKSARRRDHGQSTRIRNSELVRLSR